jgi:hypothetical protein
MRSVGDDAQSKLVPLRNSGSGPVSENPTSMISLCQEGKSSPDALRRSA